MRDPAEGHRWLMRAALINKPRRSRDAERGAGPKARWSAPAPSFPPDLIAADMWLRLATRSPFHDNASQQLQMVSNMTSARLAGQQIAPLPGVQTRSIKCWR
jgi:hypothetical protein